LSRFQWDRGIIAGAFSFGFLISAVVSPCVGLTDRRGLRLAIETGVVSMSSGLLLASLIREPWQLYSSLGALVDGGVNLLAYTVKSLYLTNWFVRRPWAALSIALSGVGAGSVTILPCLQSLIADRGWRTASWSLGLLVLVALAPLNLLLRRKPADLGLEPDGDSAGPIASSTHRLAATGWASVDWTLARPLRTRCFWWLALSYFCALFTWYLVQVHQTKYLIEVGFDRKRAAWALGLVSLVAVPGQIALGHLSDHIRREWVWTIGNVGFVLSCAALRPARRSDGSITVADGGRPRQLGYSLTSVMAAFPCEEFRRAPFRQHFRRGDVGRDLRRCSGALGCWGVARFDRRLLNRLLALDSL
jgi:sugar phosphate permease